jgi:copper chaperone CopZ
MHYVHSVPGRLRVRAAQLRGQQTRAAQVRHRLEALQGIQSVTVSTVTGSILISYDSAMLSLNAVWAALRDLDCAPQGAAALSGSGGANAAWVGNATDALIEGLVQKVAEASAMALLRAFI